MRFILEICAAILLVYTTYLYIRAAIACIYRRLMCRIIANIVNAVTVPQFNRWCSVYSVFAWNLTPAFVVGIVSGVYLPEQWYNGRYVLGAHHLKLLALSEIADRDCRVFITMVLATLYAANVRADLMGRCQVVHEYWQAAIDRAWWLWPVVHIYERCERRAYPFSELSPNTLGYYVLFVHGTTHWAGGVYNLTRVIRACVKIFR